MRQKFNDTEIVFKDLSDAFCELMNERSSPVKVRRCFRNFFILSQQLSDVMREEYKELTPKEWEPNFTGWNEATKLLKKLRNTDSHASPVLIKVNETQLHFNNDTHFFVIFTRDLGDPFSDEIPDWCSGITEGDTVTGMPLYDKQEEPRAKLYRYILHPRTKDVEKLMKRASINDIHQLSEKCFQTLKAYYDYYNECVEKNRNT